MYGLYGGETVAKINAQQASKSGEKYCVFEKNGAFVVAKESKEDIYIKDGWVKI